MRINAELRDSPGQNWVEYLSADRDRAQKIANIHAYRILGNMNREIFYDHETYTRLTSELGQKGIFEDEGYEIYDEYYKSIHDQSLRAASDGMLPTKLKEALISREKELESWIQENHGLYGQFYDGIIQPMLTGKMDTITHEKVVSIVAQSPDILPAMRMAYEIAKINNDLVSSSNK